MSVEDNYGHEGPIVEGTLKWGGKAEVDVVKCESCNVNVMADKPEKLREFNCSIYSKLSTSAKEEVTEQWD